MALFSFCGKRGMLIFKGRSVIFNERTNHKLPVYGKLKFDGKHKFEGSVNLLMQHKLASSAILSGKKQQKNNER